MNEKQKETCSCQLNNKQKIQGIRDLLKRDGDIPKKEVNKAVTKQNIKNWHAICDCRGHIISAVRYEQNDWYLCTIKNLVTDRKHRGKGYAGKVTKQAVMDAVENKKAKVIAADITYDNQNSQKIFKKLGFKQVNRFCWAKGKKPADILHYVLMPPVGTKCQ